MTESPPFSTMRDEPTPGKFLFYFLTSGLVVILTLFLFKLGGPLTEERIKTLGIIKMNDYIKSGSRQQFWEEYYVRVVMQVKMIKVDSNQTG